MKTFREFIELNEAADKPGLISIRESQDRSTKELVAELKRIFTPDRSSNKTIEINRKPGGKFEVVEYINGEPGSQELTSRGATGGQRAVMIGKLIIDDFEKLKKFIKNAPYADIGI